MKWIGLVGHVGRQTDSDRRRLDPDVQWQLSRPSRPLWWGQGGGLIGRVDVVVQVGEDLFASGCIFDDDPLPSLAGLYPEIDLDGVDFTIDGDGVMTCTEGRICAVTLGPTPAWSDLWIKVGA